MIEMELVSTVAGVILGHKRYWKTAGISKVSKCQRLKCKWDTQKRWTGTLA